MTWFTKDTIVSGANNFISLFGVYILWISAHYACAHFYIWWCVPPTILGLVLSPFMVPSPHCQALRWVIFNGGNSIMAMWVVLGIWLMKMFKVNKIKKITPLINKKNIYLLFCFF
jgi:hypothetical protein